MYIKQSLAIPTWSYHELQAHWQKDFTFHVLSTGEPASVTSDDEQDDQFDLKAHTGICIRQEYFN